MIRTVIRVRWRLLTLAVVALAAGGAAVALAGSSGSAPTSKTGARAFIRAVTLQAGDLPGFAPFGGEAGSPPDATEKQEMALRCGHQGKPRGRAIDAGGSLLADRSEEGVGSVAVVMPSEALAKAEIAALASRDGRRCLAHGLRLAAPIEAGSRSPVYAIKLTFVPASKALGREAVDVHLLATLRTSRLRRRRLGKHRVPPPAKLVYAIGAIFRVGAADIVFFSISTRRQFPDAATERRLLGLLYKRANAVKL